MLPPPTPPTPHHYNANGCIKMSDRLKGLSQGLDVLAVLLALPTLAYAVFAVWASWFYSVWGIDTAAAIAAAAMVLSLLALLGRRLRSVAAFCIVFCVLLAGISFAGSIHTSSALHSIPDRGVRLGLIVSLCVFWIFPFSLACSVMLYRLQSVDFKL